MSKRPEFGTGPHVLEADGIRLAFDSRPVLDVYLRVQSGQVVGLLGRNGSGKSVLLQTIFGARAPCPTPRCA